MSSEGRWLNTVQLINLAEAGPELLRKSQGKPGVSGSVVLPVVLSAPGTAAISGQRIAALTALANVRNDLPDEVIAGILKLVREAAGTKAARRDR